MRMAARMVFAVARCDPSSCQILLSAMPTPIQQILYQQAKLPISIPGGAFPVFYVHTSVKAL